MCWMLNQLINYTKFLDKKSNQQQPQQAHLHHHQESLEDHAKWKLELDELNSNTSFDEMLKSDITIKLKASPSVVIKTQSELSLSNENENLSNDQQVSSDTITIIRSIKTSNQFHQSPSDLLKSINPDQLECI
ncbi:uncharacterized protein MELLADRAFT_109099 [Melampsora larici-populina 98AG31]|uniref:Uncharacterized protein n=1 Tax=Melampsora larici-populina (strain 98AG31 / pathotype 3-4-7) TaxID=747676 RepID=F4RVB2_MELLP|nr:uncharacterized protein MELLADRAFT_109099 [Melampsora larici-populina 98AG31]EGG03592.1 hypothetical protein MELLADRAFT_109099 [Melampsora larici-populina 98AG31]